MSTVYTRVLCLAQAIAASMSVPVYGHERESSHKRSHFMAQTHNIFKAVFARATPSSRSAQPSGRLAYI